MMPNYFDPKNVKTLLAHLKSLRVPKRSEEKPLRMPVAVTHKIGGIGHVMIGRIDYGLLRCPGMQVKFGIHNDAGKNSIMTNMIAPPECY